MDINEHNDIVAEFKRRLESKTDELAECQQQRDESREQYKRMHWLMGKWCDAYMSAQRDHEFAAFDRDLLAEALKAAPPTDKVGSFEYSKWYTKARRAALASVQDE